MKYIYIFYIPFILKYCWYDIMNDITIGYYDNNATKFIKETIDVDFSEMQNRFLKYIPYEGHILDFGCGSGRDTLVFINQRYTVEPVDGSREMCRIASEITGIHVRQMLFCDLNENARYDGIWACASLLHLKRNELSDVFVKMHRALKNSGVAYVSFKYGDFEGERNGRYFTDMTEERFNGILEVTGGFSVEDMWITGDVRDGRSSERWMNVILRKKNMI